MGSRLESNSNAVRKQIENHAFENEEGEEYEPSKFGGFPEYFRRKKIKLQNLDTELRTQAADEPQIFRGIVAHVNGYTQPSLNELHRLIVMHGGGFIQYLDGKTQVTHIIASNLTLKKAVDFGKYRIVKPAWIVESVKAGRLLPWGDYRLVDEGVRQKVLKLDKGNIQSQVNQKRAGYRDQPEASWYTRQLNGEIETTMVDEKASSASSPIDADFDVIDDIDDADLQGLNTASSSTGNERGLMGNSKDANHLDSLGKLERSVRIAQTDGVNEEDSTERPVVEIENYARLSSRSPVAEGSLNQSQGPQTLAPDTNKPAQEADFLVAKERSKRKVEEEDISPSKKSNLTAEEHNTALLSDPRLRKSSVLNPDFLEQYYRESRLHHLSTWKADLKSQLQAMTAAKTSSQKALQRRAPNARRYVLHVDFDSFFVAVSLKNHPQLVDRPAVVAHGNGSGSEIASCNYPARKYGVKNGMWMKRAQDMCPDLKVLPYDFPAYESASKVFYDAIMDTGGIVQSVSIDEALVDVSALCLPFGGTDDTTAQEGSIWREQAKADEIAQSIRGKVKAGTGCAVSVGIGGNILLAKVALRKAKPAGQHQIKPEEALKFLGNLVVQELPGVAYSIGGKLEEIGIKFVKDIREATREKLTSVLGPKTGEKLWNYSRGIDRTEVGDQVIRKSVSAEVNWGVRFETQEQAEEFVESLCGELQRRLLKEAVRGKQLTMKIMRRAQDAPLDPPKHLGHGKCDTYNKSILLCVATNTKDVLAKEALSILRSHRFSPGELRGLGVQMQKLEPMKPVAISDIDRSQRRLQFKTSPAVKSVEQKQDTYHPARFRPSNLQSEDPIQDHPETPKKPPPAPSTLDVPRHIDSPSRKPLNTLGTQFVLPSQVDPKAVAELPQDIQSKLAKHLKPVSGPEAVQDPDKPTQKAPSFTALPNQSQLDPGILESLPSELRSEVLAEYNDIPPPPQRGQSVLPQSPRRNRTVRVGSTAPPRGQRTRGRPRGSSLLTRLRDASSRAHNPTLTQSNFVAGSLNARPQSRDQHTDSDSGDGPSELEQDFLAALPNEIRREVVDKHECEHVKRTAGLEVLRLQGPRSHSRRRNDGEVINDESVFRLPPRPARPTFTVKKLYKVEELREAVSAWFEEFREEGPYYEDVDALGKYLAAVVGEERDMGKAVSVVSWIGWVLGEGHARSEGVELESGRNGSARGAWRNALEKAKAAVTEAVKARGLGDVDLDLFI